MVQQVKEFYSYCGGLRFVLLWPIFSLFLQIGGTKKTVSGLACFPPKKQLLTQGNKTVRTSLAHCSHVPADREPQSSVSGLPCSP